MDGSLKDRRDIEMQRTDSFQSSRNQPIFVDNMSGEVHIQLEGSHTTTSETESDPCKGETSVHFDDRLMDLACSEPHSSSLTMKNEVSTENLLPRKQQSNDDVTRTSPQVSDQPKFHRRKTDLDLIEIEKENETIGERFKQIMDLFDAFTRNLETLELKATPTMRRFEADDSRRNAHDELRDSQYKIGRDGRHNLEMVTNSTFALYEETVMDRNSISTTTSGLELQYQNVPCQTSLHENFSIGQTSVIRSASGTSRSEFQQSLNNYARADNALKVITPAEGHPLKLTHSPQPCPNVPTVIVEDPCSQPFNTIHIEAMSTTSSSALQRQPLCQRLWDVITDFCAAICLCLQVNRDCIFCLGFFAAFVVSASFLTAFFYRTLSVSPPLWQSPPHRLMHGGAEIISGFNPKG